MRETRKQCVASATRFRFVKLEKIKSSLEKEASIQLEQMIPNGPSRVLV